MKTIQDFLHNRSRRALIGVAQLMLLFLFTGTNVLAAGEAQEQEITGQRDESTITTGSGKPYQTTVERHTQGELSAQDLHQVSLPTSRIVNHLNEAVDGVWIRTQIDVEVGRG